MNDLEVKDILLTIQNSILTLHTEMADTKNSLHNEIVETRISLQKEIADTRDCLQGQINDLSESVGSLKQTVVGLEHSVDELRQSHNELKQSHYELAHSVDELKQSVKKIELTLENETNKKIDALFDSRMDELRHRKENAETREKVADLEMRVDNLEKAFQAS